MNKWMNIVNHNYNWTTYISIFTDKYSYLPFLDNNCKVITAFILISGSGWLQQLIISGKNLSIENKDEGKQDQTKIKSNQIIKANKKKDSESEKFINNHLTLLDPEEYELR